jgi:hypothetical protein
MLMSIDCFIRDNNIQMDPLFAKMIVACLLPLGCIILIAIFWLIFGLCRRRSRAKQHLIISVIVLIFVCLPSIVTITFSIFNCQHIFGTSTSYLAADMSIECWTGEHLYYAKSYGIPIVIIWVFGLPVIAFI